MILELVLAWWQGLHTVIVILAWIGALSILFGIAGRLVTDKEPLLAKPMLKVLLASLGLMLLTTIPTPDRLWEVRVAMLKLDLASPENVKAVGGHVEEIVKALECKHLGVNCPKEAK